MEATTHRNVGNGTSDPQDGPKMKEIEQRILVFLRASKSRYNTLGVIAESIGSYPKVVERHVLRLMGRGLIRYSEDPATHEHFYIADEEEDDGEEGVEQVLAETENGARSSSISELVEQLSDQANGEGWEIEIRIRRGPNPKAAS